MDIADVLRGVAEAIRSHTPDSLDRLADTLVLDNKLKNEGGKMTVDGFNGTNWSPGMKCIYEGEQYSIDAVNFGRASIGISTASGSHGWVYCEEIT
ncbi:MAG: hypothetical protein GY931_06155, partial [Maribacter sp.]|nr:hypothetical protein [Maribacter sp.]